MICVICRNNADADDKSTSSHLSNDEPGLIFRYEQLSELIKDVRQVTLPSRDWSYTVAKDKLVFLEWNATMDVIKTVAINGDMQCQVKILVCKLQK